MDRVRVRLARMAGAEDLPLPRYATAGAAGADLHAAIEGRLELRPGERASVPTGIRIALPDGYEAQVRPRSGLARDHGVTLPNAPGTIDSDYRGEIRVLLWNAGPEPFAIERGARIAQLVVAPVSRAEWLETRDLDATGRGEGGFGSTGGTGHVEASAAVGTGLVAECAVGRDASGAAPCAGADLDATREEAAR